MWWWISKWFGWWGMLRTNLLSKLVTENRQILFQTVLLPGLGVARMANPGTILFLAKTPSPAKPAKKAHTLGRSLQVSSLGWVECALACRRQARAMTIRIGTYWPDMWLRGSSGRAWGPVESWTPVREADRTFIWLDPCSATSLMGV